MQALPCQLECEREDEGGGGAVGGDLRDDRGHQAQHEKYEGGGQGLQEGQHLGSRKVEKVMERQIRSVGS